MTDALESDVLIIGAGLAGLSLALRLAPRPPPIIWLKISSKTSPKPPAKSPNGLPPAWPRPMLPSKALWPKRSKAARF